MKIVNKQEFENTIKEGVVLVDFFATWCGPCKMLAPVLDELSKEITDVKFIKVDVDQENELASQYGIMSIPTLYMLKDGKVVNKAMGFQPKETLESFIKSAL